MNKKNYDTIRSLVSGNKLKEALEIVLELYDHNNNDKTFTNPALMLKQQLSVWEQLYMTGQEPAQKDKQRIAYSLLLIADELEKNPNIENYRLSLEELDPNQAIVLAIPENAWNTFFQRHLFKKPFSVIKFRYLFLTHFNLLLSDG